MEKKPQDDAFAPPRSRGSIWPIIAIVLIMAGFVAWAVFADSADPTGLGIDLDSLEFLGPDTSQQ